MNEIELNDYAMPKIEDQQQTSVNNLAPLNADKKAVIDKPKLDINNERASFAHNREDDMQKKTCFRPIWEYSRLMFRWTASVIAVLNNSMDVLYSYSVVFVSQTMFFATCALLLIRIIGAVSIAQYYYSHNVKNFKFGITGKENKEVHEDKEDDGDEEPEQRVDERGRSMSIKDADFINNGKKLYGSFYLMFYIGLFRILPVRYFPWQIGIGYVFEFVFCMIPMLMCQVLNNQDTNSDLTPLQRVAMLIKLLSLFLFFVEFILFVWEAHQYK